MNPKRADYTGRRFGKLIAIRYDHTQGTVTRWLFRCDCGNEVIRRIEGAKSGHTQSCGCRHRESVRARSTTHGKSNTRMFQAWAGMRARCRCPTNARFHQYGGRGIKVCDKWDSSFEAFLADMGERPAGYSLERIDNDRDYEPGNCVWTPIWKQAQNKRSTVRVTLDGETVCLAEACRRRGLNGATVRGRIRRGMTPQEAISHPARHRRPALATA